MSGENVHTEQYILDAATREKWIQIQFLLKKHFRKKPDLNAVLFLLGMQEMGQLREYSKEEKMDLMHIATCKILSYSGYYSFQEYDAEGWPHWKLEKPLPAYSLESQENFLKEHVVLYFEKEKIMPAAYEVA